MAREILSGAVLDLHKHDPEATLPPVKVLTTVKACEDCAHLVKLRYAEKCGRTVWHDMITGAGGHLDCSVERTSCRQDACGLQAVHFVPTVYALSARSARRAVQQERLQEAIAEFKPDTTASLELIGSIKRALADRYGEHRTSAVQECIGEVEEALADLEREMQDADL